LTFEQFIDTRIAALNAQWTRPIDKLTMIVGGDYPASRDSSGRISLRAGDRRQHRDGPFLSGGTENVGAGYARANMRVHRLR
jgi:hypothetical protein